jgi:hypothetical protein
MLPHIAIRQRHWTSFIGIKVLAYWYNSTNTDISAAAHNQQQENDRTRSQFSCFTSKKVQILTQKEGANTAIMCACVFVHETSRSHIIAAVQRQYLYFCTSKASTFLLVKQEN